MASTGSSSRTMAAASSTAPSSSIEALPAIAEAVAGRMPILLDGGVRRGADVVKALALGARACLIARPQLWGLAVAGEAGVARVLDIFRERDRPRHGALRRHAAPPTSAPTCFGARPGARGRR